MNDPSNRSPAGMRYPRTNSLLTPIIVISNIFENGGPSPPLTSERGNNMTDRHPARDHEHLPGDGHETVEHDGHVDHKHDGELHSEEVIHEDHDGTHTDGDGHETVEHGDHVDHIHDGHRHHQHGDHVHEH
jgi:hypothetical protein